MHNLYDEIYPGYGSDSVHTIVCHYNVVQYIDALVQDCSISSELAVDIMALHTAQKWQRQNVDKIKFI